MIALVTPSISFDAVTPEEYPVVVALWEASVRATHHFVTEEEILFYKPLILREYLRQMTLTCARNAEGAIVGFSGVAYAKLEMLFLHPDARGKGIGKALLRHVIEELGVTHVDVNEENEQALKFYLKEGFQIISRSEVDSLGKPHPILHLKFVKA